jgi:DNA-binding MarR family transcriptional regulator
MAEGAGRDAAGIRLGPLEDFIGFHLRLAQEASFRAFAERVGDPGLRPSRFAMLAIIRENPGLTQRALSRASGRDTSTLTTALDDLVRRGLVVRERAEADRRSYALSLTPRGQRVLGRLTAHARAHDDRLDALVGSRGKATLLRLLRRIVEGLDGGAAPG